MPAKRASARGWTVAGLITALSAPACAPGDATQAPIEAARGDRQARIWQRLPDMPTARSGAAAFVAAGRVYVIGGQRNTRFLSLAESFDPATGAWAAEPPIRLARSFSAANSAVVDDMIYVIGGNPRGYCTNASDVFDTRARSWRLLPAAPVARCHATVLAAGGAIYAIGGWNTSSTVHYTQVDRYEPSSQRWHSDVTLPRARGGMAAGVVGRTIVLAGGWTSDDPHATSVDRYDLDTKRWSTGAPMSAARHATASAVLDGRLYVIGGLTFVNGRPTPTATVESYDLATDTWRREPSLPVPVSYGAAAAVNGSIYLSGGVSNHEMPEILASVFVLAGASGAATSAPAR